MQSFWATFKMGFKYLWHDPISVVLLIAFPIAIIFILGNALASYISVDTSLEPVPIAVVSAQDSDLADYLRSDEILRFFELSFTDKAHAEELVRDGDVEAAIIEEDGDISVLRTPGNDINSELTLSVVDAYRQISAAAVTAVMRGADVYALLDTKVEVLDKPLGKRVPGAMDYYAVTMLVMILLYSGMNGHDLFSKSVLGETGARIRLSPISLPAHIGGLIAASTATSCVQGFVVFAFTGLAYGVYWGDRIPLVLLTLFAVVLFSQSLCIFLTVLLKSAGAVSGITQGLFWVMTFVSKGYSKINFGAAEELFQYVPNSLAHTVIFGAVYGGNESVMMFDLALLFGISATIAALAFLFGRRRFA